MTTVRLLLLVDDSQADEKTAPVEFEITTFLPYPACIDAHVVLKSEAFLVTGMQITADPAPSDGPAVTFFVEHARYDDEPLPKEVRTTLLQQGWRLVPKDAL